MSNNERPIMFSPEMMKAIRKGIKVQTRRLVQPQHQESDLSLCPYGKPGDLLYTRETWRTLSQFDRLSPSQIITSYPAKKIPMQYADEMTLHWPLESTPGRWRPSIHMPRAFSRVILTITEIRKEPLQNITRIDAMREGIKWSPGQRSEPLIDFALLWDSLHPLFGTWASNPLVWVISFQLKEMELMDQEIAEAMQRKATFENHVPRLVQRTL